MNELMRRPNGRSPDPLIKCVSLVVRRHTPVQKLRGFRRGFSIPEVVDARSQAFVEEMASDDVRNDLDDVFSVLRAAYRFRRTTLDVDEFSASGGSIRCPHFSYTSFVEQHPAKPGLAIWHRLVSEIRKPNQLVSDNFAAAFPQIFDTVELTPPSAIDLTLLIDRIEELDRDGIDLDYDRKITHCEVRVAGQTSLIRVTDSALSIVHPEPVSPRTLVESLFEAERALLDFSSFTE